MTVVKSFGKPSYSMLMCLLLLADRHAMDAFRYIVSVQEKSQRAIDLTETIIKSNPGMFTVW